MIAPLIGYYLRRSKKKKERKCETISLMSKEVINKQSGLPDKLKLLEIERFSWTQDRFEKFLFLLRRAKLLLLVLFNPVLLPDVLTTRLGIHYRLYRVCMIYHCGWKYIGSSPAR